VEIGGLERRKWWDFRGSVEEILPEIVSLHLGPALVMTTITSRSIFTSTSSPLLLHLLFISSPPHNRQLEALSVGALKATEHMERQKAVRATLTKQNANAKDNEGDNAEPTFVNNQRDNREGQHIGSLLALRATSVGSSLDLH
jgi:hypothetical protein